MENGAKKAAVFILLGQSNAVGHGVPMDERDKIHTPLKNVFGLSRETNQSFENKALTWSGYTSNGMNLAEEQDHTYSVANCLAETDRRRGGLAGSVYRPDRYWRSGRDPALYVVSRPPQPGDHSGTVGKG